MRSGMRLHPADLTLVFVLATTSGTCAMSDVVDCCASRKTT